MDKFTNNKIDFASLQLKFFAFQARLQKQIKKYNLARNYFKSTNIFFLVSSIITLMVLVAIYLISSKFSFRINPFSTYALFGSIFPLMDLCGLVYYKFQQIKCIMLNNKFNKVNLIMYNQILASSNYVFQTNTPEVSHTVDPRLAVDPRLTPSKRQTVDSRLAVQEKKKFMQSQVQNEQFDKYKKTVSAIKDDEKER